MTTLDTRGMRCPWPAIRLARALRDPAVAVVDIRADDPAAPGELASVAHAAGWSFETVEPDHFRARR